jgi:hypothetical protein
MWPHLLKYIEIIRITLSFYTSEAVFPIGIRSQSSCAILFIWKGNMVDISSYSQDTMNWKN